MLRKTILKWLVCVVSIANLNAAAGELKEPGATTDASTAMTAVEVRLTENQRHLSLLMDWVGNKAPLPYRFMQSADTMAIIPQAGFKAVDLASPEYSLICSGPLNPCVSVFFTDRETLLTFHMDAASSLESLLTIVAERLDTSDPSKLRARIYSVHEAEIWKECPNLRAVHNGLDHVGVVKRIKDGIVERFGMERPQVKAHLSDVSKVTTAVSKDVSHTAALLTRTIEELGPLFDQLLSLGYYAPLEGGVEADTLPAIQVLKTLESLEFLTSYEARRFAVVDVNNLFDTKGNIRLFSLNPALELARLKWAKEGDDKAFSFLRLDETFSKRLEVIADIAVKIQTGQSISEFFSSLKTPLQMRRAFSSRVFWEVLGSGMDAKKLRAMRRTEADEEKIGEEDKTDEEDKAATGGGAAAGAAD